MENLGTWGTARQGAAAHLVVVTPLFAQIPLRPDLTPVRISIILTFQELF